ncbi:MAG: shikimate dehydrogenase [Anaerocolumna sp.]|jgi:shikimate kinase|nr:shikimate dehydrogenase [Anaerocolumna sp.]
MNNIILIGFMGCGKTSVGKELAKAFECDFYDTDALIVSKKGQSISDIFAVHGESYFRNLETNLIKDLIDQISNAVISVGGGLPIQPGNAELLQRLGTVIYLKTSRESIKERLLSDTTRPLLKNAEGESRLDELYTYREPIYQSASDLVITTDNKGIDEIVYNILESRR